ncbi:MULTISPECIES: phosphoribosylamine--glycine ligase [Candidatus Ichthyocystis]|uniref:phosphoribosylamine--glycine ligase n=1 Tax=Candidatus Ichthyocystis TaxID=2929841 RepID=UPI000B0B48FB|nr:MULTISPECIES: phosphoribosylamine--glycine ligase [Ichthyocystis]
MRILVVGSGGREHAMAWRLSYGARVSKIYVAPGNAGTASEEAMENVPIAATDIESLADFAKLHEVDYTIVGGEQPLELGIVDLFRSRGIPIIGPMKDVAQMETSKIFAKEFMTRHSIPTAKYSWFDSSDAARVHIDSLSYDYVIKADGLAAGKGVFLPSSKDEAYKVVDSLINERSLGNSGASIIVEERLNGTEISFMVLTDGKNIETFATSRDYKRLRTGDLGPNTGGMGATSPVPSITPELYARIMREIVRPTIKGVLTDQGVPYTGFLYFGIMLSSDGSLFLLEYNCRLGDPETQVLMMRLKSDFSELLFSAAHQKMESYPDIEWDTRYALVVVIASEGYPSNPVVGRPILSLPDNTATFKLFHSGTTYENGCLLTSGGRVFGITVLGETARIARKNAYDMIPSISFKGMQYRSDIGYKCIKDHS